MADDDDQILVVSDDDDASDDTAGLVSDNSDDDDDAVMSQPYNEGEDSLSGSTAGLESDDNALDAAQVAGLYDDADEEHPVELNLAAEIEKDERNHVIDD
jgi:hypothetical protein